MIYIGNNNYQYEESVMNKHNSVFLFVKNFNYFQLLNVSLRKPFDNSNLKNFYRLLIKQNSRYSRISLIWTIITTSRSNTWLKAKIIVFARSEYNVAHYTKIQLVQNVPFGSINFFFQNHLLSFWKIKSFILENMSQSVLYNYTLHPITKKNWCFYIKYLIRLTTIKSDYC
jgi:hypothetical protein